MLSKERNGRFTAYDVYKLSTPGKVRDALIRNKAEERLTGQRKVTFKGNKNTEHGEFNEYEAIEMFAKVSGMNVVYLDQEFFPYGEHGGATPDAGIFDFDDRMIAVVDVKCPTSTFFEQKMMILKEAKPEYQNLPKDYFYQLQKQMMSVSAKLGYPVKNAYLVRYLTSSEIDEHGNKQEFDLPLEVRTLIKHVTADANIQTEIAKDIVSAAAECDILVDLLKQEIPFQIL